MIIADYVAIGVCALALLFGLIAGFGKGLKFFTGGIFGIIIAVVVAYFFGGVVMNWSFVADLMTKINEYFSSLGNTFGDIMIKIRIDMIAVYVALFIIAQIVRIIIVSILKSIFEINNGFVKFINKVFGVVLFAAVFAMLALIAFQIITWIGGSTVEDFRLALEGSFFKLDWVFDNNPLNAVFQSFGL